MKVTTKIAIALGTNLGDREKHLDEAVAALSEDVLWETARSKTYETPPWGYTDQPDFLNLVLVGTSDWKPHALLNYFRDYENTHGRERVIPNGPRPIDIDLIAYGDRVMEDAQISVPHPRFRTRDFVLLPLCDVWPDWVDPVTKKTALQLKNELTKITAKPL